jgi:hypothetical protein
MGIDRNLYNRLIFDDIWGKFLVEILVLIENNSVLFNYSFQQASDLFLLGNGYPRFDQMDGTEDNRYKNELDDNYQVRHGVGSATTRPVLSAVFGVEIAGER